MNILKNYPYDLILFFFIFCFLCDLMFQKIILAPHKAQYFSHIDLRKIIFFRPKWIVA